MSNKRFQVKILTVGAIAAIVVVLALMFFDSKPPAAEHPPPTAAIGDAIGNSDGDASSSGRVSADQAVTPAVQTPGGTERESAMAIFNSATTAMEGLREAEAVYGVDDFYVNRVRQTARGLCERPVDPSGSLLRTNPDSSRDWAIEALLDFCVGWNAGTQTSPPTLSNVPVDPLAVRRDQGPAAGLEAANATLASGTDPVLMLESALLLQESGNLPRPGELGVANGAHGDVDIATALNYSTALLACAQSGGCGPDTPYTLGFCVEHGCAANSDFMLALRENLPPSDFALVLAYYNWLISLRRG